MTQFKDKGIHKEKASKLYLSKFNAADILLYKATHVPVRIKNSI